MKVWSWSMCIENGFVVTSDAQVPTVKPDAMHA